jgi:hypothetical protein
MRDVNRIRGWKFNILDSLPFLRFLCLYFRASFFFQIFQCYSSRTKIYNKAEILKSNEEERRIFACVTDSPMLFPTIVQGREAHVMMKFEIPKRRQKKTGDPFSVVL